MFFSYTIKALILSTFISSPSAWEITAGLNQAQPNPDCFNTAELSIDIVAPVPTKTFIFFPLFF